METVHDSDPNVPPGEGYDLDVPFDPLRARRIGDVRRDARRNADKRDPNVPPGEGYDLDLPFDPLRAQQLCNVRRKARRNADLRNLA